MFYHSCCSVKNEPWGQEEKVSRVEAERPVKRQ